MCSPWRDSFVWDMTHLRRGLPPAAHCDMIWLVYTVTWRTCSLCHDSCVWDMTHLRRDPPRVVYCNVTPSYVTWPRANLVTVGADTWVKSHMSHMNDSCLVCHERMSHVLRDMSHINDSYIIDMWHVPYANPTWGDNFECCFKAQSSKLESLFSLKPGKREIELWALSLRKCHPKWNWMYFTCRLWIRHVPVVFAQGYGVFV